MIKLKVSRAVKPFLRLTTLHGFKYLGYPHNSDRVGWLVCCCASVCGAAVLCVVLLARFRHSPLLLSEVSLTSPTRLEDSVPMVAICPSPYRAAQVIAKKLSKDIKELKWLPTLLNNILRGKPAADHERMLLDELLHTHNLTLARALENFMSPCKFLMSQCQWQSAIVPCSSLFEKMLTRWGNCCVMRPERIKDIKSLGDELSSLVRLDLVMDCYVKQNFDSSCTELFIKYPAEDWLGPWYLTSGYSYVAQIIFIYIHDTEKNKLMNGTCVSSSQYSQSQCMIQCLETECGCSHPLRLKEKIETNLPPQPCSVMRMKCLGNFVRESKTCNCFPACQRIAVRLTMEESEIKDYFYSYNPIYANVNSNSSIILNLRIRISDSKSFNLLPTDTWLTLLSSLGGVFNMFLGVGLFSLLECLFLLLNLFFKSE